MASRSEPRRARAMARAGIKLAIFGVYDFRFSFVGFGLCIFEIVECGDEILKKFGIKNDFVGFVGFGEVALFVDKEFKCVDDSGCANSNIRNVKSFSEVFEFEKFHLFVPLFNVE
jgi:hypothetical protein